MWRDTYASRDERSYYVCRRAARKRWGNCTAGGISAQRAERIVTQDFLSSAAEPYSKRLQQRTKVQLVGHLPSARGDRLEERLAGVENQMERLIELSLTQSGPLAAKKFQQKAQALEQERGGLTKQIADGVASGIESARRAEDVEKLRKGLSQLPRIWDAATPEERNHIVRLGIDRIDISGDGRPKELKISWADWMS